MQNTHTHIHTHMRDKESDSEMRKEKGGLPGVSVNPLHLIKVRLVY